MTAQFRLRPGPSWLLESAADLDKRNSKLSAAAEVQLLIGTGSSQADRAFADTRTLAASANENLDLAGGGLLDPFGNALTFVKVKGLYVRAAPANANLVNVKPGAANGFLGPFNAAADTLKIPAGGWIELYAPVSGWAVTAGTGDILNIANSGAGTSVTYDIIIIGTSA